MAIKSFKSLNKYFYSHAVKMVHSCRTFLTLRTLLFHSEKLREYDTFLKKFRNSWLLFISSKFLLEMEQFTFLLIPFYSYLIIYSYRKPGGTCNQVEVLAKCTSLFSTFCFPCYHRQQFYWTFNCYIIEVIFPSDSKKTFLTVLAASINNLLDTLQASTSHLILKLML